MKVHVLSVSMLAALFGLAGCSKPSTEIVEADYSYTLDKNVISVEMPEKFVHNPSNLVASTTDEEVLVVLNNKTLPEGKDDYTFQASVKLKRPMDAPVKVVFKLNAEQTAIYKSGLGDDFAELAEGSIEGLEFSIPDGVTSFTTNLTLKNAREILNTQKSLCGVFSLYMVGEQDGVMISKHSDDLYVKVFTSVLVSKPNVSIVSGYYVPNNWKLVDHTKVRAASNYLNNRVSLIVDGNSKWGAPNWWAPSKGLTDTDAILALYFDEAKIVGFRVVQNNPPKTLKSFDVGVSVDNGQTNYAWGHIADSQAYTTSLIIKFNEPELINTILLYNLMSNKPGNDSYIDIHEIEVYTVE